MSTEPKSAEQLFVEGCELFENKKFVYAEKLFTQAILLAPQVPKLLEKRCRCYLSDKRQTRAVADAEEIIALMPWSHLGFWLRGLAFKLDKSAVGMFLWKEKHVLKSVAERDALFAAALSMNPGLSKEIVESILAKKKQQEFILGLVQEIDQEVQAKMIETKNDEPAFVFYHAKILSDERGGWMAKQRYLAQYSCSTLALQSCSTLAEQYGNRAVVLSCLRRFAEAEADLDTQEKLDGKPTALSWRTRALLACHQGQLDVAKKCMKKCHQLAPSPEDDLSTMLPMLSSPKQSAAHAAHCKEMGNSAFRQEQYDHACEFYTAGLLPAHTNKEVLRALYANMANCRLQLLQPDEALALAEIAIQLDPLWFRGYQRAGGALCLLGKKEEAIEKVSKAVELVPEASKKELLEFLERVKKHPYSSPEFYKIPERKLSSSSSATATSASSATATSAASSAKTLD